MEAITREPNRQLRHEREIRGWSQRKVAEEVGTSMDTVGKWERGINTPDPYFREKLCALFERNAAELGFIEIQLASSSYNGDSEKLKIVDEQNDHINGSSGLDPIHEDIESQVDMDKMRRMVVESIATVLGLSRIPFSQDILHSDALDRLNYAAAKPSGLSIDQPTLARLTKINEGCWHLTNGSELTLIEQLLPTYLPKLATASQQKSENQPALASLAAQGYLLDSLVALDHLDNAQMTKSSTLAVMYSGLAQDYNLHAAALKQQATMCLIDKKPNQALKVYQKALPFIHQVSPLLQSRIYQGLASASARCGLDAEADRYIGLAFDTFPSRFEEDPSFLFADSGLSVLHMYAGLTYLDLDDPRKAWDTFAQVDGMQPKIDIGEWTRLEFLNLQTKAAVAMKDQELSRTYLEAAVQQADKLDSRFGRAEAFDLWQSMRFVWSGDRTIKQLGSLFV